ncbi:Peptidase aspartic, putative,Aspartic peptidase domain,Protein of unknown function DUF1759,Zinc finger [Cinara cedri]|uniref:Uncharacterized protein n=1 Tax=Cinara cedri TaxID=506608 RepID=A0A5E4MKV7_9HEMI|nr:Peptidase aspartic, putative,Aspartic peptidase domain,Protein of unknown function DUF1759,Zinc finger [Cinara cedri]
MMLGDDKERVQLLKQRCEIRRMSCMDRIRSVYSLAVRSVEDSSVVPQLLDMVETLDQLLSSFNAEDETLLQLLLDLELGNEYSKTEFVEMFELVSFIQMTVSQFMQSTISVHGDSQMLSNANKEDPQIDDHMVDDTHIASSHDSQSNNSDSLESSGFQVINSTRSPEILLPTFHGNIYEWISFRDRFVETVDRRTTLSDIEKLYYLVGCCEGVALETIQSIPVSDQNYKLAWSTLQERFDKPGLLAYSIIEKLLSAPRATSETSVELNKVLTVFDESLSLLESMKIPNLADFILFSIASRCLPTDSIKLFEAQLDNTFPTVQDLLRFMKLRMAILECIPREPTSKPTDSYKTTKDSYKTTKGEPHESKTSLHTSMVTSSSLSHVSQPCKCCKGTHDLTSCSKFKGWSHELRNKWARDQRICFRCLRSGHWAFVCKSRILCSQCSRWHHSLLHPVGPSERLGEGNKLKEGQSDGAITSSLLSQNTSSSVILGTALIHIPDNVGSLHTVRALIDSASQISAITSECTNRLGLRMRNWTAPVSGLGGVSVQNVLGIVNCQAQSRYSPDPVFNFEAWVFPSVAADMPRNPLSRSIADKYQHLALADPSFINPGAIDVLLGADLFAQIMNGKRMSVGDAFPVAFGTVFGWTVIGPVPNSTSNISVSCSVSLTTSVETLLEKFWAPEEPDVTPEDFTQKGQCEAIFRDGCTSDSSGRFCIPFLFRRALSDDTFNGSRVVAAKRFQHLEKKLTNDPCLRRLTLSEFIKHEFYLNGPPCLQLPSQQWDKDIPLKTADELPKFKVVASTALVIQEKECEWCERFSSYVQAIRITVHILCRFIVQCRKKTVEKGYLSRKELDQAALLIVHSSQQFHFVCEASPVPPIHTDQSPICSISMYCLQSAIVVQAGFNSKTCLSYWEEDVGNLRYL